MVTIWLIFPSNGREWVFFSLLLNSNLFIDTFPQFPNCVFGLLDLGGAQWFAFITDSKWGWCCFGDHTLKIMPFSVFSLLFFCSFFTVFCQIRVFLVFKHWSMFTNYFYIISRISTDLGRERDCSMCPTYALKTEFSQNNPSKQQNANWCLSSCPLYSLVFPGYATQGAFLKNKFVLSFFPL